MEFISRNNLSLSDNYDNNRVGYTYRNGEYKAYLDHIIWPIEETSLYVTECTVLDLDCNLSDHLPISTYVHFKNNINAEWTESSVSSKTFHHFNWKCSIFIELYNQYLDIELNSLESIMNDETYKVDDLYRSICRVLLKSAREAEKENLKNLETTYYNKPRHSKLSSAGYEIRFRINSIDREIKSIRSKASSLTGLQKIQSNMQIQALRQKLRFENKKLIKELNSKRSMKFEKFFKFNRSRFWKEVSKFKKSSSYKPQDASLESFEAFYQDLFCADQSIINPDHHAIEEGTSKFALEIRNKCFNYEVTEFELNSAIKNLKKNKAVGFDNIPAEMLINAKSKKLTFILTRFYSKIFNTGRIPHNFNVSIVTPMPKNKVEAKRPEDFRPISVSSCFANVLEHIMLQNIDIRSNIHMNQFGYKNQYSCKHAYFVVNETIHYYNNSRTKFYMASLDAQKAFDKLWRAGLFKKLKNSIPEIFWRTLYNYYEASKIVVKFDGKKSNPIKITDGVKQGGILSSYLFNFYINDLLKSCTDLNIR